MKADFILSPFSTIYAWIIGARKRLYQNGVFASYSLGAPTISIGNITVGGTGKTPLVALTAKILAENGEMVCVLTRGYGRDNPKERVVVSDGQSIMADSRDAGDEPYELAGKLLGVSSVVADADRVSAGNWACEKFGVTAFILDDGFQHLRVRRQLDIVCVDATNPFGNGHILPRGILREPLRNLKRADAVVITRANLVGDDVITAVHRKIEGLNPGARIFSSRSKTRELIKLDDLRRGVCTAAPPKSGSKRKYLAFCGLGNPDGFFRQLRQEGFDLRATEKFPDHYFYKQGDIRKIETAALESGAEVLLTTHKDGVKLSHLNFNFPCFVVESEIALDDETAFRNLIKNVTRRS